MPRRRRKRYLVQVLFSRDELAAVRAAAAGEPLGPWARAILMEATTKPKDGS
jgi:hypothetical protein